MSTRALIIGKAKDGTYRYGQTKWDGYANLEWLQRNMTDPDKVDEMLQHLTEGGSENNGHGISSLSYKSTDDGYDYTQPYIDWYKGDYNCGIASSKEEMLEIITVKNVQGATHFDEFPFDFPEYLSYWNGKEWLGVGWDTLKDDEDNGWRDNWHQFATLIENN